MRFTFIVTFLAFLFSSLDIHGQILPGYSKKTAVDSLTRTLPKPELTSRLLAKPIAEITSESATTKTELDDSQDLWYVLSDSLATDYWSHVHRDEFILQLKLGVSLGSKIVSLLNVRGLFLDSESMHPELQNFYHFKGEIQSIESVKQIARELRQMNSVEFFEPCAMAHSAECPSNDPYVYVDGVGGLQWGLWTTQVDEVWCYYQGGSSNWTAIIDSGTDWFHEDLYNTAWYGYDYADNDSDPTPPENFWDLTPSDNTHGTHVAGIVGAEVNNGIGVAGVSNDTLYIAKVKSDASTGSSVSTIAIINALNDIATIPKIKVVNLSLGSYAFSAFYLSAVDNCWNAGKVVVASAGNDAVSSLHYPSSYSNCISVSSLGLDSENNYEIANYTNFGNIDICAPGGSGSGQGPSSGFGGIYSTTPSDFWGEHYGYKSGTSMAAPLVSGIVNTLFASNPFLSNQEARDLIEGNPLPGWSVDPIYYGNGVVCAWCAYEQACLDFYNPISVTDESICPGEEAVAFGTSHPDISYQWYKNNIAISGATQNSLTITTPGSYYLESTSVGNCVFSSSPISVNYAASPSAQFSFSVNQNFVSFNNQSNNAISHYWSFGDGNSSTLTNPGHTYSNPGTYQVSLMVTNECGISSTSYSVIIISPPSGIYDLELLDQISVGPNPSTGNIVFQVPYEGIDITILDLSGRIIFSRSSSTYQDFEYSGLSTGQYLVRFRTASGASRIVKINVVEN